MPNSSSTTGLAILLAVSMCQSRYSFIFIHAPSYVAAAFFGSNQLQFGAHMWKVR